MRRTLVTCALASVAYALLINGGTIAALIEHRATPVHMGIDAVAADEAHYFALMESAAHGRWLMGSASLREWENSTGNVILGPMLQGAVLRWTGLPLSIVVWAGDLLFPSLAMFILCLMLLRFVKPAEAISIAVLLMNTIGLGWLRSVNPQITIGLFALYLLTFLRKNETRNGLWLRGGVIAILCFVQIQMALYCMIAEVLLTLLCMIKDRTQSKKAFLDACTVAVPVTISILAVWLLSQHVEPAALADSRRRLGLIGSHLPAAPSMQLILLIAGIGILIALRRTDKNRTELERIGVLLLAGLAVLNQSMIHGIDAIFGIYYHASLMIVVVLAFWITASMLVKQSILRAVLLVLIVYSVSMLGSQVRQKSDAQKTAATAFVESKVMDVLTELKTRKGRHVVLAPFEISNLVPLYTESTVEYNRYSRFGIATDIDLAKRFILYRSVFPHSDPFIDDPTHSLVLGQYAGNLAARKRSACEIFAWIRGEKNDCAVTIRSQIYHQELLPILDDKRMPDQPALMREFGVDTLVTKDPLPKNLQPFCTLRATVGDWRISECAVR